MPSPEHAEMVEQIIANGQRTPEEPPTPQLLAAMRDHELASVPPTPDDMQVEDATLGGVPCVVVSPRVDEPSGTIVFVHGGGYIWMTAHTHLLVAAGLVALRDAGDALPAAVVSISPWTDLAVTGASADTADDPIVSGTSLRMMARLYLDGARPDSPTASPLYADLRGLPPVLVQVGTREALLDDARRLVERARAAGVDVTLREYEEVVHMWVVIGPDIPESVEAFQEAGTFIRTHVAPA